MLNQNDKKVAYIIGVSHPTCGIIAIWKNTLAHILYAFEKGYTPIVDLKHYQNQYFKDGKKYIDNAYEYFFNQPCQKTLDNLNEFDEVIISDNVLYPMRKYAIFPDILPIENVSKSNFYNMPIIKEYKKYFEFNSEIKNYLISESEKKLNGEQDILGILCRGTDYLNMHPKNHLIQPNPNLVIKKAKSLYEKYKFKKIYLATEDRSIYKKFKKEFGDILIDNSQYMYPGNTNKYISSININRENHNYNLAKEYLLSLYILSKCKYFIGGRTAGTLALYLMTNGFEYDYIWNLGHYGEENKNNSASKIEKIFSVKNSENKKHKIVTILGIKFKFRRKEPYFSIIMPTYNRAFCIENAINSLINQTYSNWELVIIDDGSTDNTKELIKQKYSKYIRNKKIIYKKIKHRGQCYARNIGLKTAKHTWIGYLDTDNELYPKFLKSLKNAIIKHPKKQCFYVKAEKSNGGVIGKAFDFASLCESNYIDMGGFVHNKSLVKKNDNFDTNLKRLEDWDLIVRYTRHNKPYFIDKVLFKYNQDNKFRRISNSENIEIAREQIYKKIKDYKEKKSLAMSIFPFKKF